MAVGLAVLAQQEAEWEAAVDRFVQALEALKRQSLDVDLLSQVEGKSRLEMLQMIAAHNSYHLGQVVVVEFTHYGVAKTD